MLLFKLYSFLVWLKAISRRRVISVLGDKDKLINSPFYMNILRTVLITWYLASISMGKASPSILILVTFFSYKPCIYLL